MKKNIILSLAACAAVASAAVPFSASAADTVYGTMNIPYADFYAAEFEGSNNSFEVDAVSSSTPNKWSANAAGTVEDGAWKAGGLSAGTYNDGAGTILGVTYPVAVSSDDVAFLTEKYGFTALSEAPAAYKEVTVNGDSITVSKVIDNDGAVEAGGGITLDTTTNYGDYQLTVENYPQDADVYGCIVKTSDGSAYPMRQLENLWRPKGQIAWSIGYVTTTHGNTLVVDNYDQTEGKTVTEVDFITLDGYRTVSGANIYLPKMFAASLDVKDAPAGSGSTTYDTSKIPSDYAVSAEVAGEGFTPTGSGVVGYKDVQPGTYTLTVSDKNGVYANVKGTFTLTSADIPVEFKDGKLVAAEGFTEEQAANYLKNISSVTVGENSYNASGRRGIKIIGEDGSIDYTVQSGGENIFAQGAEGAYSFTVKSTGYTSDYSFDTAAEEVQETTTAPAEEASSTTAAVTTAKSATTTKAAAKTTAKASSSNSNSPKTGVTGAAAPVAGLALAAAAAFALRKKND